MQEQSLNTRAANLQAVESEFGRGWELVRFQRLYIQTGGAHIRESGTGTWFLAHPEEADGTVRHATPAGDFSTVRRLADKTYRRTYPAGTVVCFDAVGKMQDVADRFGNAPRTATRR